MKVIVRQVVDGEIKSVFSLTDPFDIQVEIGIQNKIQQFQIFHDPDTALLRITVCKRLVVFPASASTVFLTEVK